MWRFMIIYIAFCVYVAVGNPGPKYPATKGEVWPRPYQETKGDTYYTLYPPGFQLKVMNHTCDILTAAVNRCTEALEQLNDVALKNRLGTGHVRPELNLFGGSDDEKYLGNLTLLEIVLENPCEEYPRFGMDENYNLNISSTPELRSKSIWGILRGLETFTHLLYLSDDYYEVRLNTTTISDAPRYAHRGLLIDTSRHYLTMDTILKTLDAMAMNKMNVFHWHIVDDQSFPYQSEKFPELSKKGAYFPTMVYTKTDVETVIAYARNRGIRVVPEFDVPGHTLSWGKAYPSVLTQCYQGKETTGLGPMNPLSNSTYKLLKSLFAEVRGIFPDQYLHVGGDEVDMRCWESNPELTEFMKNNNMSTASELHALFMRNTMEQLDNSTKVIVWQEVFDENVPLAKDTLVQVWKDALYSYKIRQILTAGYQMLFSTSWYLDHLGKDFQQMYTADPRSALYDWTRDSAAAAGIVGGEACMWGERADDRNVLSRVWPRASAVAEVLWSHETQGPGSWPHFVPRETFQRIEEHTCRMIRRGIPAEPADGPGFCVV